MENKRAKIFALIAIIILIVGVLFAKPGYRAVRSWRANRLAAEAEAAIARQAWPEAAQKAQAAYHLAPMNPRAMRIVARLYTIAGQPDAVTFWENLRASGNATLDDRRELIRVAMRFGKAASVRDEVFRLA